MPRVGFGSSPRTDTAVIHRSAPAPAPMTAREDIPAAPPRRPCRKRSDRLMVTVFTKPACVQCNAAYKALEEQGTECEVVDVSVDDEAREYVMARGHLQAPVVVNGSDHWSGFRPARIKALARAVAERTRLVPASLWVLGGVRHGGIVGAAAREARLLLLRAG